MVSHISSIYANPWLGWVLFGLLFLAVLNPSMQANVWVVLRGMFSHSERAYSVHTQGWLSEICSHLFRIGVVAVAMLILAMPTGDVVFTTYAKVLAVVAVGYALQRLSLYGVGVVFLSRKYLEAAIEQYDGINALGCICLYPVLVLLINVPSARLAQILCMVVLIVFVGLLLWKSFRLFYVNILSILYILLYVICLEIIPIIAIFSLSQTLVCI